jgi:hypothetical protein
VRFRREIGLRLLTHFESFQVEKQYLQRCVMVQLITRHRYMVRFVIQRPNRWRLFHTQAFGCINEFVALATSEQKYNQRAVMFLGFGG